MKLVKQFRYYGSHSAQNYPRNIVNYYGVLTKGNLLSDYPRVSHLGIQGLPGTQFYLNDSDSAIEIGLTGIYELDLGNNGLIHSIQFATNSINQYDTNTSQERLLIDIVYEGGI